MLPRAFATATATMARVSAVAAASHAVDSGLIHALKMDYLRDKDLKRPPRFHHAIFMPERGPPPEPFEIAKGAIDFAFYGALRVGQGLGGPVLRREYEDEEISMSVMRPENNLPSGREEADNDASSDSEGYGLIKHLLLHVNIAKAGKERSLHFLCGLYPDVVGIHSVASRPKGSDWEEAVAKYQDRAFQELNPEVQDALHTYIKARGITEKLFPFLHAWLYIKEHRDLMIWFRSVGVLISEPRRI